MVSRTNRRDRRDFLDRPMPICAFGLPMDYKEQLLDERWKLLSKYIKERDSGTCQICKNCCGTLDAHHIEYKHGHFAWEYMDYEIVTLCRDCHEWVHFFQHEYNEIFKSYYEYKNNMP